MGELLLYYRTLQCVLTWRDSAATTLLYLFACLLTLLLALVPWLTVVPFVVHWTARLVGLAVLGPHMYWVGERIAAIEADEATRAQAAASTNSPTPSSSTSSAPPKDGATDDDVDGPYAHVLELESARGEMRKPCLPDLKSAFSMSPACHNPAEPTHSQIRISEG